MEGIDPNPDNYVAGAILSTSTVLVGCLLRLEPNKQTEVSVCVYLYVRVCARMHACMCVCLFIFLLKYCIVNTILILMVVLERQGFHGNLSLYSNRTVTL